MSFHEVRFPEDNNSYGSRGGPGYNTSIVEVDSGAEQRVARRSSARHQYSIDLRSLDPEDLAEVKTFYMARRGAENGFRLKDWADFTSNPTNPSFPADLGIADQFCTPPEGDGSRTTFQLTKTYTSGPTSSTRAISKPVDGTVQVWLDGVEQVSGWSVNYTTGLITFTSAPTLGVEVKASFEFDVPVRFDRDADELMSISVDDFASQSTAALGMVEIIDPASSGYGDYNHGGSVEISIAANYTVAMGQGRLWVVVATVGSLSVVLPDRTDLPNGDRLFVIVNGGANTFTIKDELGVTLATLTTGQGVEVGLTLNSSETAKTWYAM